LNLRPLGPQPERRLSEFLLIVRGRGQDRGNLETPSELEESRVARTPPAPFPSVLCGVDSDPASTVAVRQAIALATPGATFHFIAVSTTHSLPRFRKEELLGSLDEAGELARGAGIAASTELIEERTVLDLLLPASEHHDLLVVGSRSRSRASGILLGSTAGGAAHETQRQLLVAREPPAPGRFPGAILFASDGSPGSWAPARAAAAIAASFNSALEVVHVVDRIHAERLAVLEAQVAEIREVTGAEPGLKKPPGHSTEVIIEAARERRSSLIVCGRRGLHGLRALGSVSERVVHRAPCSVLLIQTGEWGSGAQC
jgi:nucleotide-binding universal stress UspA family protein